MTATSDKNKEFNYQANEQQNRTNLRKHLKELLSDLIQQDFVNKETGLVATLTSDDVNKISSNEAISKSKANDYTQEEHFKVAEDITNLYENATLKETHKDYKERPNITNVHRFNIDVEVNSKDTTVKITMFERVDGKNRIYTLELQKLDPLHNISRVSETEVVESLSSEVAPHNDPSIYCDSSSLVRRGIEPTHTESHDSTLPSGTSLTNSNADNITNKQISQAQETTDFKQVVENPKPQSDKDYIIGKQLNDRKMGDVGIRSDEGTNVIFHANEKRIGSLKSHIKKKIVAIDGRDALTPYTQAQSLDGRLVQKNISSTATANTIPNPTLNNTETTNLKQITRDTAVLAPQSSALLIKTYEQLGEERLAHTLISTIETDKVTMQEVSKEYMNLSENDEAMIQSSEWIDENKNSQESDKNIKTTPKPKIKTMFGKKNNGENND